MRLRRSACAHLTHAQRVGLGHGGWVRREEGWGRCEWGPSEYESEGPHLAAVRRGCRLPDILARCGRPPGMGSSH